MIHTKHLSFLQKGFWIRETFHGRIEYRTSSKIVITVLPLILALLLYKLLLTVERLENGPAIIMVLALSTGVLLIALILLVLIISLIEYLRTFE